MPDLWLPESWLERPVRVLLIGAGGTGSHLFGALMALDHSLRALDHPGGLHLTVYDPDRVTTVNVGRQAFWPADVGQNKAVTLVQRAHLAMGLDWRAKPRAFQPRREELARYDLIVTAVDRARTRAEIGRRAYRSSLDHDPPILWLDTGNSVHEAQIILGDWRTARSATWIPNVFQLYPERADLDDQAQRAPSCSAAESLARQWLPIHRIVADVAQNLLWMLFRQGRLDLHGAVIHLATLSVRPLRADPQVWASFGWQAHTPD
ncbi:MAG TPA: PRTRC system ThiF family protein [Candidatus Competibacteraceae bacterium]|nr:PRTRC system ThiF family protein [Candidatus Competibacteraceae bacterium]